MPDNFAVYLPLAQPPSQEQLDSIAPGAEVRVSVEAVDVVWPDVSVRVNSMPREQVPQHLQGMVGWARQHGGSDALITRIFHTLSVAGCEVTPGFDAAGKAINFCATMTAAAGFCFLGGTIRDGDGRDLIADGMPRPSADDVRYRAEILLACAVRALLEDDAGKPDHARAEAMRQQLVSWVDSDAERISACDEDEVALLETPIGAADKQSVVNAVWAAEAACVMLWALEAYELPAFTVTQHPYDVAHLAGIQGEPHVALQHPKLRDEAQLVNAHRKLMGIHWRLRDHSLKPGKAVDFKAFAAKNFLGSFALGDLPMSGDDLAVDGRPLSQLTPDQTRTAMSIARERHRGINWVMGVHQWASVETPT